MTTNTDPDAERLEQLWQGEFGDRYVERNSVDYPARRGFWERTIARYSAGTILEVGCAHGDNFRYLDGLVDLGRTCGIDINEHGLLTLRDQSPNVSAVRGAARHLPVRARSFDTVFTIGLLIHQPDSTLPAVMRELARCSRRWVMFGEYSSVEPTEIEYRGLSGVLFKRDYVSIFEETCPEYRHVDTEELTLEADGFDRVTWGVFERR
ncbi:MAG TPA: methyltransferase domain-containing protein [Microthrixaceae bacterium]|jgi:pseudaminic acid biosynthesis-associated methylase|nr:methyltransferase domain-containing protein [Microthrixaceae bacterium]